MFGVAESIVTAIVSAFFQSSRARCFALTTETHLAFRARRIRTATTMRVVRAQVVTLTVAAPDRCIRTACIAELTALQLGPRQEQQELHQHSARAPELCELYHLYRMQSWVGGSK